jgi:hypothetical protein
MRSFTGKAFGYLKCRTLRAAALSLRTWRPKIVLLKNSRHDSMTLLLLTGAKTESRLPRFRRRLEVWELSAFAGLGRRYGQREIHSVSWITERTRKPTQGSTYAIRGPSALANASQAVARTARCARPSHRPGRRTIVGPATDRRREERSEYRRAAAGRRLAGLGPVALRLRGLEADPTTVLTVEYHDRPQAGVRLDLLGD